MWLQWGGNRGGSVWLLHRTMSLQGGTTQFLTSLVLLHSVFFNLLLVLHLVLQENVQGSRCDQCRIGTFHLDPTNPKGCTSCFCFGATDRCRSSDKRRAEVWLLVRSLLRHQGWSYVCVSCLICGVSPHWCCRSWTWRVGCCLEPTDRKSQSRSILVRTSWRLTSVTFQMSTRISTGTPPRHTSVIRWETSNHLIGWQIGQWQYLQEACLSVLSLIGSEQRQRTRFGQVIWSRLNSTSDLWATSGNSSDGRSAETRMVTMEIKCLSVQAINLVSVRLLLSVCKSVQPSSSSSSLLWRLFSTGVIIRRLPEISSTHSDHERRRVVSACWGLQTWHHPEGARQNPEFLTVRTMLHN